MPKLGPEERLLRLENARGADDGKHVCFDIITKDGKSHIFWMAFDEIGKFVSYMVSLSQFVAGQGAGLERPQQHQAITVDPIEAVSIGIAPGRSDQEALLSIHTGTMALVFATTPNELASLRDNLNRLLAPIPHRKSD